MPAFFQKSGCFPGRNLAACPRLASRQQDNIEFGKWQADPGSPIDAVPHPVAHAKMQLDRNKLFGRETSRKLQRQPL